jgi:hypothetical protein
MPQQKRNDWSEWATLKLKELASKENRPIDDVSFRHSRDDVVELVIESCGKKTPRSLQEMCKKS